MSSNNTANISSYTGFNTFKYNFLLEGDESRIFYQHPIYDDFLMMGDPSGNQTTIAARTLEWGVNTVHPDNTPTIAGRMSLPDKWGKNGTFLGINGGIIDWIDAFDTSNNNFFGFSNYGTRSIQNKLISDTNINTFYDNYRYISVPYQDELDRISEKQTFTGTNLSEVKLSSTIGAFCDASAIMAVTVGWQNFTNENFSMLYGNNLEISNNILRSGGTGGEVVLGRANRRYNERQNPNIERVLTVGCGNISNDNTSTSDFEDAFYITKTGESYFNNNINSIGGLNVSGTSTFTNDILLQNSALDVSYIFTSGMTSYGVLKSPLIENEQFVTRTVDFDNIGTALGKFDFISDNGIYFKKYKMINSVNYAEHADTKLTHTELAKNRIIFDNTSGIQIFTTRAVDKPVTNDDSNTNYSEYTTEQHNKAAFGGIQILHPTAYYDTDLTGYGLDASGIYPPTLKDQFRGCHLTWYGLSGEEIQCNEINIKGLKFPPTTKNETIGSANYHIGRSDLVLGSNGDGTCEWRAIDIQNAVNLNITQLANIFQDNDNYVFIGKESETADPNAINTHIGIRASNLIIDSEASVGSTLNVTSNTTIGGYVNVGTTLNTGSNATIGGNTSIGGFLTVQNRLDVSNNVNIEGKTIITNSVDISGNIKSDGDVHSANIKASGQLDVSSIAVIDGGALIGNDVYINGKTDICGNTTIDGYCDVSNTIATQSNVFCGDNMYFKDINKVTFGTKVYNEEEYTSIFNIISDRVNYAISNSISNPACSIIWFARNSPPENYMVCNGRYFNQLLYPDLSNNLPSHISKVTNDIEQNFIIKIDDNLTFGNDTIYSFEVIDPITREKVNDLSNNSINLVSNTNLTFTVYNSSSNLDILFYKITSDTVDMSNGENDGIILWSTQTKTTPVGEYSNYNEQSTFTINSSPTNSVGTTFKFELYIRDSNNFEYLLYNTLNYNKNEIYVAQNQEQFRENYMKIPNLIDTFCKGAETNIGLEFSSSLENHKHINEPHTHSININESFPHSHSALSSFTGATISDHQHEVAVSYINVNSSSLNTTNPDISLVVMHPNSSLGNTTYKNTSLRGQHTLSGVVTTIVDTTDDNASALQIDISNETGATPIVMSDTLKQNDDPFPLNETAPKHMNLLPCIALGSTNVISDDVVMDTYSTAMRLEFLERRLAALDICLNTTEVKVHNS